MTAKRCLSLMLALALAAPTLAPGTRAAERAVSSTLRLDAVEGTVSVRNRADKYLSFSERMKLYSGYILASALASYGYISLDDAKAIKLNALSEVEIKQSGQKLEVDLISGSLFFDVTAPLREEERLNIRTSTMVTGIRGTSGFVRVISEKVSEIYLLTGTVQLTSTDPITGEVAEVILRAGQRARSVVHAIPANGGKPAKIVEIIIDTYVERDVPGYVAVAIRDSARLQAKITEQTELSVPLIIALADERLADDEAALLGLSEKIARAWGELENNKAVNPLFGDDVTGDGGGGTSAPTPPMGPRLSGTVVTQQVQDALAFYPSVIMDGSWVMASGDILDIAPGRTLTIEGSFDANGNRIINRSNNTLVFAQGAVVTGAGSIWNGDGSDPGRIIVENGVTVSTTIENRSNGTIEGTGALGHLVMNGGDLTGFTGDIDSLRVEHVSFSYDKPLVNAEVSGSGSVLNLLAGASVTGSMTVDSSGAAFIQSGSMVDSVLVSAGGGLDILTGGGADYVTIDNGGGANISGEVTSSLTVNAGGVANLMTGGEAYRAAVNGSGTLNAANGSTVSDSATAAGGTLSLANGSTVGSVFINSGATSSIAGAVGTVSTLGNGGLTLESTAAVQNVSLGGTGTTNINCDVANNVAIISTGTAVIDGDVAGAISLTSGSATLKTTRTAGSVVSSGNFTSEASTNITGTVTVSGGTNSIAGWVADTVTVTGGALGLSATVNADVQVAGPGTLNISGSVTGQATLDSGGVINLLTGGSVTHGDASPIVVVNAGLFNLSGGVINRTANVNIDVVRITGGRFAHDSGTISGNNGTAPIVNVANGATYAMSGTASVSQTGAGDAIYVAGGMDYTNGTITSGGALVRVDVNSGAIRGGTVFEATYGGGSVQYNGSPPPSYMYSINGGPQASIIGSLPGVIAAMPVDAEVEITVDLGAGLEIADTLQVNTGQDITLSFINSGGIDNAEGAMFTVDYPENDCFARFHLTGLKNYGDFKLTFKGTDQCFENAGDIFNAAGATLEIIGEAGVRVGFNSGASLINNGALILRGGPGDSDAMNLEFNHGGTLTLADDDEQSTTLSGKIRLRVPGNLQLPTTLRGDFTLADACMLILNDCNILLEVDLALGNGASIGLEGNAALTIDGCVTLTALECASLAIWDDTSSLVVNGALDMAEAAFYTHKPNGIDENYGIANHGTLVLPSDDGRILSKDSFSWPS